MSWTAGNRAYAWVRGLLMPETKERFDGWLEGRIYSVEVSAGSPNVAFLDFTVSGTYHRDMRVKVAELVTDFDTIELAEAKFPANSTVVLREIRPGLRGVVIPRAPGEVRVPVIFDQEAPLIFRRSEDGAAALIHPLHLGLIRAGAVPTVPDSRYCSCGGPAKQVPMIYSVITVCDVCGLEKKK